MTHVLLGLIRTLLGLAGMHINSRDLLAYRDGELSRLRRWRVRTHVDRCEVCRQEGERIRKELSAFARWDHRLYAGEFLSLPKGLGKLLQAIEDWEVQGAWGDRPRQPGQIIGEAGLRQLATEFDFYLGNRATAAFLQKLRGGEERRPNLLREIEAVLSDFLGPGAASAVTYRILRAELSMDARVGGSPAA